MLVRRCSRAQSTQHVDLERAHQAQQLGLACQSADRRTAGARRRRELAERRVDRHPLAERRPPARRGSRTCRRRSARPAATRAGMPAARASATNSCVCSLQSPRARVQHLRARSGRDRDRLRQRVVHPAVDALARRTRGSRVVAAQAPRERDDLRVAALRSAARVDSSRRTTSHRARHRQRVLAGASARWRSRVIVSVSPRSRCRYRRRASKPVEVHARQANA